MAERIPKIYLEELFPLHKQFVMKPINDTKVISMFTLSRYEWTLERVAEHLFDEDERDYSQAEYLTFRLTRPDEDPLEFEGVPASNRIEDNLRGEIVLSTNFTGEGDEYTFELRIPPTNNEKILATVNLRAVGYLVGLFYVYEK